MVNKNGAFRSMVVIMAVYVGLNLPEIGQDLLETPLIVAEEGPPVEVFWCASVESR
jgi:hypothetical protein